MVKQKSKNLLCTDLIRIAVFNKDAIDFYNMKCMLGFQVVGQHITFYLLPYYTMLYFGQKRSAICKHHRQMKGFYRTWSRISQLHCTIFQGSGYGKSRLIKEIMYKC
ncbi:unnamed protein product [Rhizophagus irregularis]|nr:unnamed protein product [Rhizophagus irregularis]